MNDTLRFYGTVDEVLGAREGRYFGDGYVNCSHSVRDFTLQTDARGITFSCVGAVAITRQWSKKDSGDQKPHLSTIDVIDLSIECFRVLLKRTMHFGQPPADAVKSVRIVAGKEPVEDCLDAIPITGQVRSETDATSVMSLRIANMDVEVSFLAVEASHGVVLSGGKQSISVQKLMLNTEALAASALVGPNGQQPDRSWSIDACFAAMLQVGQALLYEMDDIKRAESNTLWMKKANVDVCASVPQLTVDQPIHVFLDDVRRYTKGDGDWRRADICGIIANTKLLCSVTHKLPDRLSHAVR